MDRSTRRLSDDPGLSAEGIDVEGISPAIVDQLPDTVLARMLRRVLHERSDPAQCYANFMNGPKTLLRPAFPDGPDV